MEEVPVSFVGELVVELLLKDYGLCLWVSCCNRQERERVRGRESERVLKEL